MALFQKPARTPEEIEKSKPHDVPAEQVLTFDEAEWFKKAYRGDASQLTVRAFVMGSLLGFFLAFTNVYAGLKVGWLLDVAITACILSFAISTFLTRAGAMKSGMSILETNCMQSTASAAGYTMGVTFAGPFPAMLMLSVTDANPKGSPLAWWVAVPWVVCIGTLGVFMAIPMKRNLINKEKLRFPYGTASAVTLQGFYSHGKEALTKARTLLWAAAVAGILPVLKDLEFIKKLGENGKIERHAIIPGQSAIFDGPWHVTAKQLNPETGAFVEKSFSLSAWNIRLDHSLLLVGAGVFVGLRATIAMLVGGLYVAFVLGPQAMESGWTNALGKLVAGAKGPGSAWKDIGIWYGAPLLVAYGLVTFAMQYKTIARSMSGIGKKSKDEAGGVGAEVAALEVPVSWFAIGVGLAGAGIVALGWKYFAIPPHLGAIGVFMSFFLCLVSARATGETGITPGGPMGKITQLVYGILIPQSTTANLMTAAITSGAGLGCSDLLNDLRAGYLLGANPRRQFLAQFLGVLTGSVASVLAFFLLVPDASVFSGTEDKPAAFAAPAAQQWKVVAELFQYGIGNLHPLAQRGIVVGLVLGTGLAIAEALVPKHKKWVPSATGLGLGMLLPFFTPLSMFIGALGAYIFSRVNAKQHERFAVPLASGVIAGESIIGVVVAALNNFVFA